MYFSISAPQQITLPTDPPVTLSFRVNAQDSSLCEIHIVGKDGEDVAGTHILTFKRNGAPSDTQFVEAPKAAEATYKPDYSSAPSVDKDAVRKSDWETKQPDTSAQNAKIPPTPPAKPVDTAKAVG